MILDEEFEGVIEKVIFGAKGLLRHSSGMFVQVMGVLHLEKVRVRICRIHKNYAEAELIQVLEPSIERIDPKCSHFGICGGCQLQHMKYHQQTECKKAWLQEALSGLFDSKETVLWSPSSIIWKWRKKIVLHAERAKNGEVTLGYFGIQNGLFQCHECPIFCSEDEKDVLVSLKKALGLFTRWESGDVVLFRRPSGHVSVQFRLDKRVHGIEEASRELSSSVHIEEVTLFDHGIKKVIFGSSKEELAMNFRSFHFGYSEESFVQTHPEQPFHVWDDFYAHVQKFPKKASILDLYSGIGVTATLAASLGHDVTAVEISREASKVCQETAKRYNFKSLQVVCSSVEKYLSSLKKWPRSVILNPPRQGVSKEVLLAVASSSAEEIHYISCQPATLRRDLMILTRAGWNVQWAKGYDMFPQTTHFETYVRLSKRSEGVGAVGRVQNV